jgi:hypothetical protein
MSFFRRIWEHATSGVATATGRIRRFLLNRALGSFILNPLVDDDQFELAVSEGIVKVRDVQLNVKVRDWRCRWCVIFLIGHFSVDYQRASGGCTTLYR